MGGHGCQGWLCPHSTPTHRQDTGQMRQLPTTCKKDRRVRKEWLGTGGRRHGFPTSCLLGRAVPPSSPHLTHPPHSLLRHPDSYHATSPPLSNCELSICGLLPETLTSPHQNDRLSLPSQSPTSLSSPGILPSDRSDPPDPPSGCSRLPGRLPPPLPDPPLFCPPQALTSSDSLRSPLPFSPALPSCPSSPEPGSLRLLPRQLHLSD